MRNEIVKILMAAVSAAALIALTGCGNSSAKGYYTGIIEAETHTVSSPVSDRLTGLEVSEGDWVMEGTALGQIDDTSLRLQLKGLQSGLEQIDLQEKEGELNLEQIKETYEHYNTMYRKNLSLFEQEAVSDQSVRDLKLQVDKWRRDRDSLEIQLKILKSKKEGIQYQISGLEETISKARLTAASDGFIDKIYYEKDEFVPPLGPVLDLVNLDETWCYIYVGEETLAEIIPGEAVKGRVSGYTFNGRISHINSKAEFSPKEILSPENRKALVYAVKVDFTNHDKILKIGMPIDVYLENNQDD